MKELGVFIRWGRIFPGKEKEALDFYAETTRYFTDRLGDGSLTFFEPFLFLSGDGEVDNGFFICKGPEEKVLAMVDEPRRLELEARATQLMGHVTVQLLLAGEGVFEHITRFATVNQVLVPA